MPVSSVVMTVPVVLASITGTGENVGLLGCELIVIGVVVVTMVDGGGTVLTGGLTSNTSKHSSIESK